MPACCGNLASQNPVVQENRGEHTDEAKRMADQVNLHIAADADAAVGKVIAVSLADGSSDGELYPDKYTAALHQHHNERYYAFIRIPPNGMPVCDAESFLWVHRMARSKSIDTPDLSHPAGGLDLIPQLTNEGLGNQIRALRRLTGT